MRYPNLREERKLRNRGFKVIVGLDEAGRGPLGGPVVACAVAIAKTKYKKQNIKNTYKKLKNDLVDVRDSKKLSQRCREDCYKLLVSHPDIQWATGRVSEKVIDKINILEATRLAMKRAIKNLEKKTRPRVDFLILDGNLKIDLPIPQKSIIKADEKVFSCSCASIIAKVTRDRIMERQHKKYPKYGFDRHKGYGTCQHFIALKKHGPCKIHRRSFRPVLKYKRLKTKNKKHKLKT